MSKKTILFVYPVFFYPRLGGVERVTDILAKAFVKQGHQVTYLYYQNRPTPDYDFPAPLYKFPAVSFLAEENYVFYHQFLKEHNIDIIINQSGNFGDSVLFLSKGDNVNVKSISVLHSSPLVSYNHLADEMLKLKNDTFTEKLKLTARVVLFPWIKWKYKRMRINQFKFLFEHTDKVCLLSEKHKEDFKDIYSGSLEKITAIGNPNSFNVQSLPENKEKIVLYVGRLELGEKRVDRVLKIWEKVYTDFPDWKLQIVGEGSFRKRLEKQAKKLDRVFFEGYQNPESYYKQASISCLTSNAEGFGMALTEAMQYGVVPITFNSFASASEIINDGVNGYLAEPYSINDFASKLRELMINENKRKEMSRNAFSDVKKYDLENIVSQWEKLFDSFE